jgi:hypothetical protein
MVPLEEDLAIIVALSDITPVRIASALVKRLQEFPDY